LGWFEDQEALIERQGAGAGNRGSGQPENYVMPGGEGMIRPQVQDNWGRSPSDPAYGQPPADSSPGGPAPVAEGSPGGPTRGTEQYSDQRFLEILHQFPPTYDGARRAASELDRVFGPGVVSLIDHPTKLDKFRLPGGRIADQMYASGSPQARWNDSIALEQGGGGGGGALNTLGGMAGGGGNWQAGLNPAFDFMIGEAQKGFERSGSSQGILNTGGFQKALGRYLADYAMGAGFQPTFNNNLSLAQLGLSAAGSNAQLGSQYNSQAGNLTGNQAGANTGLRIGGGTAQAGGTGAQADIWGNTIGQVGAIAAPTLGGLIKRRGGKNADPYEWQGPPMLDPMGNDPRYQYRTPPYVPEQDI